MDMRTAGVNQRQRDSSTRGCGSPPNPNARTKSPYTVESESDCESTSENNQSNQPTYRYLSELFQSWWATIDCPGLPEKVHFRYSRQPRTDCDAHDRLTDGTAPDGRRHQHHASRICPPGPKTCIANANDFHIGSAPAFPLEPIRIQDSPCPRPPPSGCPVAVS